MGKEITCDVLKEYCEVDDTDKMSTKLCEVSWNKKPCTGVDIRKYDKASGSLFKGITITYEGFTEIVKSAIENNIVKLSDIEDAVSKRKKKSYSSEDIVSIVNRMSNQDRRYHRLKNGTLMDDDHNIVITRRGMKNE